MSCLKVTFLVPPAFEDKKPAERTAGCTRMVYAMPNIYELTIAALLEKEGYNVAYEDFVLSDRNENDFIQFIKNDDSKIYCMWSVNLSINTDIQAFKYIMEFNSDSTTIFMGPAPTYYSTQFLIHPKGIVLRGEPETAIINLLKAITTKESISGIKGISFFEENQIYHNPSEKITQNLDELPFPARHLINKYTYRNPKLKASPYTAIVSSRSCPYKCIYCVPSSLTFAREIEYKLQHNKKPPVTLRSVENVIQEIEFIAKQGYKAIAFVDDNFILNKKRLATIASALKKHNFHWGCQARADAIDEETAQILADAKCDYIDLGAESFNNEILKYIKKSLTKEQVIETVQLLNKYEVPVKLNILIGTSPLETKETIEETVRETKKLKVSQIMFNIVAPFPGTEFYELAKKNNWIKGGDYVPTDVQRNSILTYPHLSSEEMEKILFRSNISFFLRPDVIIQHISKFRSFRDFGSAFKALMIKFFG